MIMDFRILFNRRTQTHSGRSRATVSEAAAPSVAPPLPITGGVASSLGRVDGKESGRGGERKFAIPGLEFSKKQWFDEI